MDAIAPPVRAARDRFPNGLAQPPGSFRFSIDALLLAAFCLRFIPTEEPCSMIDLGCGCGVVGLACALERDSLSVTGVEVDRNLARAARDNASLLGLETRFRPIRADLTGREAEIIPAGEFGLAAANMPFRDPLAGRVPSSVSRRRALFAGPDTLDAFVRAAWRATTPDGVLAFIYPWSGTSALVAVLEGLGLHGPRILPVLTGPGKPWRSLVGARRGAKGGAKPEPSLVLRGASGYTGEALNFCPWLAGNG